MNCPKCGAAITDKSGKCTHCWTSIKSKKEGIKRPRYFKPLIISMIVLAVLALAALVVASILGAKQKDITYAPNLNTNVPEPVISANSPNQSGNVLGADPNLSPGANVMSAPVPANIPGGTSEGAVNKPKPPQYVIDYLDFVKGIEEHRQRLLRDTQTAFAIGATAKSMQGLDGLLEMLDDEGSDKAKDPLIDTKNELNRHYANWVSTVNYFDQRKPPQECRDFAAYYRQVIYNEAVTIGQIVNTMSSSSDYSSRDVTKIIANLQGIMKGDAQKNIDTSVEYADTSLDNLVSNYDMQKPFSVTKEQGTSGSILGF